ncbi:MAG: HAMP domain-containing histidine kinase [Candidatus Sumerlaeia bacterium]|nr:HAMP domain-containing histidine kinase [Candidatus Sumerlaeia bacterium]
MSRWSLRLRILVLTLAVETATLVFFGAVAYNRSRKQLLDSLDDQIRDEIETIVQLAGAEAREGGAESPAVKGLLRLFSTERSILFQIRALDGRVLVQSPRLNGEGLVIPQELLSALLPGESDFLDLQWRDNVYRTRVAREAVQLPSGKQEFFAVVAKSRRDVNGRLERLLKYNSLIGATTLVVSAIALWIVAGIGLAPVRRLSGEVESVAPRHLDYRVNCDQLPSDLRTLGVSINGFIERLAQAFAHEKQFVADAAHELCTPIALLKSNIQSALLSPPDPVADRKSLEELLSDVERLEHLTNSLLALSEAEAAGGARAEREMVELPAYLESLVAQYEPVARQAGVTLVLEPMPPVSLQADRTMLDRVLGNLIDNAIKHNRAGGKAVVSVHVLERAVEICVADTGPGVPPEDAPKLFERFFRVDKSRSRQRGGAGLGLAIAKSLCDAQGAEICYRPGETCGSVFVVRMPRTEPAPSE